MTSTETVATAAAQALFQVNAGGAVSCSRSGPASSERTRRWARKTP
ncbi:hypothetical protein [Amycolatopsis sp. NPDC004169]